MLCGNINNTISIHFGSSLVSHTFPQQLKDSSVHRASEMETKQEEELLLPVAMVTVG